MIKDAGALQEPVSSTINDDISNIDVNWSRNTYSKQLDKSESAQSKLTGCS